MPLLTFILPDLKITLVLGGLLLRLPVRQLTKYSRCPCRRG
jgi:hypothetical protein